MRRIIIALVALITATAQASLVGYETTISNSAPTLWYKNATTKSGVHMQNSGSAGSTYQVYSFAQATYTDVWGTANMAFGTTNASPAVTGSTGLFCTGAVGTVSFLFKTPTTMPTGTYPDLFAQGGNFAVDIGPSGMMRIAYTTNGTTTSYAYLETLTTDKWYYFAMKWDTSKTGNDLTWYLGSTNSTLKSGNLTIASTGTNTAPISLGGLKNPMQEIAIWGSELSDASIQSQFSAIPEPATVGLFGAAALGLMILRRRIMS